MNAENQILSIVIVAVLGSNGIMAAVLYWLNTKSKGRLIEIQSRADARIKQLEIQLIAAQARREKSQSDEKQSDKLMALPNDILYMLGKSLDQNDKIQATSENNYAVIKGLIDRTTMEGRTRLENFETRLKEFIVTSLDEAIIQSQKQYAARDAMESLKLSFPVAPEDDCNWYLATVNFTHASKISVMKSPLYLDKNHVGFLAAGDKAYIIDEVHSKGIPGWCQVRSVDMPEAQGWIALEHLKINKLDTQTMKAVSNGNLSPS